MSVSVSTQVSDREDGGGYFIFPLTYSQPTCNLKGDMRFQKQIRKWMRAAGHETTEQAATSLGWKLDRIRHLLRNKNPGKPTDDERRDLLGALAILEGK